MIILSKEYFYASVIKSDIRTIKDAIDSKEKYYNVFFIPKKNGQREISGILPKSTLHMLQKKILENFLSKIQLPLYVKGFIKDSSYGEYLYEHIGKKYYLRMDIKDFFGTISLEQIENELSEYVKVEEILKYIVELCTLHETLPQGAITSPALSNIVFRRIDQRITKYCQKFNINYTRYADDLLFSSDRIDFKEQKWFYKKVNYILRSEGFESNYSKKQTEKDKISLGGYVVEKDVHLSRAKLNNLNKLLYFFKDLSNDSRYTVNNGLLKTDYITQINTLGIKNKDGSSKFFSQKIEIINYLCGYRSFIISIIKVNEGNHKKLLSNKVKQIEKLVKALE